MKRSLLPFIAALFLILTNSSTISASGGKVRGPCVRGVPLLSLSPQAQETNPGENAIYNVSVTNTDSVDCQASKFQILGSVVNNTGSGSPDAVWMITPDTFLLAPGEIGFSDLEVSVPDFAFPPISYSVQVTGLNQSSNLGVSAEASLTVPQKRCFYSEPIMTLSPATQEIHAGETASYTVTLESTNGPDCMIASYFWKASLRGVSEEYSIEIQPERFMLEPGAIETSVVKITAPAQITPGEYTLTVHAEAGAPDFGATSMGKLIVR